MIEFIKKNFYSNRSITGPGIKNILTKQLGGNNSLNNARATILALETLKTPLEVATARNKPLKMFYKVN